MKIATLIALLVSAALISNTSDAADEPWRNYVRLCKVNIPNAEKAMNEKRKGLDYSIKIKKTNSEGEMIVDVKYTSESSPNQVSSASMECYFAHVKDRWIFEGHDESVDDRNFTAVLRVLFNFRPAP